jgi:uncharacterized glyoxalase superfamily protein PhnB
MSVEPAAEPTRIFPTLRYRDAPAMIAWLGRAFGFTERAVYPGEAGAIAHAELAFGAALIMLSSARDDRFGAIVGVPGNDGPGNGQAIYVAVDDVDAHHARAQAAGAEILMALTDTDYGSRDYICRDPEGYVWCFGTYWPKAHEPAA